MKILMVNTGVFPIPTPRGGAENHVYYLSKEFAKLGYDVHVVSDVENNCDLKNLKNIKIIPINLPNLKLFEMGFYGYALRHLLGGIYSAKKAFFYMKEVKDFDIVHIRGQIPSFLLSIIPFRNNSWIYTLHSDPPKKGVNNYLIYKSAFKLCEYTAKRVDFTIAVSENGRDYLIKKLKIDKDKVAWIPPGTDVETFKPLNINREDFCMFVGSLTKRKGLEYLIKAIYLLREKDNKKLNCLIVGDGPEKQNLMKLVNKYNLNDQIKFMGIISDKKVLCELYNKSIFFVLPSITEGLPQAMLEAMACEKAVCVTKTSGIPRVIKDGYNGFLVEPKDPEKLREVLCYMLDNPDLCKEVGKNARKTVEENFSWKIIAKKTLEVYKKVLEGKE